MGSNLTRRQLLGTMGTTGALALAGCAVGDDEGLSGALSIGVLQDFSGPLPQYGAQGTAGFYNGLAQKAGTDPLGEESVDAGEYSYSVGDIDVELLVRDTQFNPQEAQSLAEDLTTESEVDLLFGVGNSGGAQRVITQVVDRSDVPYIMGPAASAGLTANEETCREQVFRANENTAMDARSGGVYIADSTDVERMALFGADDTFGQSVINNYRTVLENRGVEIVLERSVASGQQEWQGLLETAENAGAQGMVGGFTASTLPFFATEFLTGDYDMQLFGGFASRVTLSIVGDTLRDVLGDNFTNEGLANADFGPFTTRYHWNQYDNEINDAFIDRHTSAYGVVPDLFTGGAFTAASATIQAVQEEGEISRDAIVSGLRGMTVEETPKGENAYTFQEYNNQARSPMTVANVEVTPDDQENWPAAIQPSEPIETVPADDVTIPASEMSCDLS
ncbi:ABC transporter substrate-binding protein [Halovenus sp. WSH3]|uniref:ABC transporter substrate-binding protein n=1 Tax=Halovenus carboxidivorans TaxID=2692199 RepID=A0A6B0TC20_9EURY|nr:ABC transporter substrate-binding protein [Halovenus carboxidivorans]MXR52450.1 ABC transporter substrate-binding protein [Halovenus carboxidivorans]